MELPWRWLLVAASTLLHYFNAAAIKAQRADVEVVTAFCAALAFARPGGPRPSPTPVPTAGVARDPSDPDECKACEQYARSCSLHSRLYYPRTIWEGGYKDVLL